MKKLILLGVVLGCGGYFAWRAYAQPGRRACERLVSLCGERPERVASCERDMRELRQATSSDETTRLDACVAKADSCPQAAGCFVGSSLHAIGSAFGNFAKGVGDAMTH